MGAPGEDNRLFLEAVLWIVRTGSPWRDLPSELGNWHTTYTRFIRWGKSGRWLLTAGQVADIDRAQPLLLGLQAAQVLADKGYDAVCLGD